MSRRFQAQAPGFLESPTLGTAVLILLFAAACAAGPLVIHELIVWQDCAFGGKCAPENAKNLPQSAFSR